MAITMNGKISNAGNLRMIDGLFRNQTAGYAALYMGFLKSSGSAITDTTTLTDVSANESTIARISMMSALGAASLVGGVPTIKNSSQIDTANATVAESIIAWFITDAASGTSGSILAYGNVSSGSLNTNVGSPITVEANQLVITND